MATTKVDIPRVDPNVQYVGVSKLRTLNATNLHSLDKTLVIQDDDKPLAVVLSYEQFLAMQNHRDKILETLEVVLSEDGANLMAALQDAADGNTTPLAEVRELAKRRRQKNDGE
jgi:hypothetical protein